MEVRAAQKIVEHHQTGSDSQSSIAPGGREGFGSGGGATQVMPLQVSGERDRKTKVEQLIEICFKILCSRCTRHLLGNRVFYRI